VCFVPYLEIRETADKKCLKIPVSVQPCVLIYSGTVVCANVQPCDGVYECIADVCKCLTLGCCIISTLTCTSAGDDLVFSINCLSFI